jgi:hypothetical protein
LPLAVTSSSRWRLFPTSIRRDVWPVIVLVALVSIVMERILLLTSGVLRGWPVGANVTRLHVGRVRYISILD